jgi:hypothetical protein
MAVSGSNPCPLTDDKWFAAPDAVLFRISCGVASEANVFAVATTASVQLPTVPPVFHERTPGSPCRLSLRPARREGQVVA